METLQVLWSKHVAQPRFWVLRLKPSAGSQSGSKSILAVFRPERSSTHLELITERLTCQRRTSASVTPCFLRSFIFYQGKNLTPPRTPPQPLTTSGRENIVFYRKSRQNQLRFRPLPIEGALIQISLCPKPYSDSRGRLAEGPPTRPSPGSRDL